MFVRSGLSFWMWLIQSFRTSRSWFRSRVGWFKVEAELYLMQGRFRSRE